MSGMSSSCDMFIGKLKPEDTEEKLWVVFADAVSITIKKKAEGGKDGFAFAKYASVKQAEDIYPKFVITTFP